MKISTLIQKLQETQNQHGDFQVMFKDPNSNGGPFEISQVKFEVAKEDEFPEDFNMPEGYEYVLLVN